jgi:uncharacterized protein YndB with AHSA1/START domain
MTATRVVQPIAAPRAEVYRALVSAESVREWMVPDGMTSEVHEFEPRVGGRVHGRYLELVPGERVVHTVEFETDNPALAGEMIVTLTLADRDGVTEMAALHEGIPPGLTPADNELGWRLSLGKLARLAEQARG